MSGKALVTGAAGFIGSHLSERLISDGWSVTGIDSFTDYYDPQRKRLHISGLAGSKDFTLVEEDLNSCDIAAHLDGVCQMPAVSIITRSPRVAEPSLYIVVQ